MDSDRSLAQDPPFFKPSSCKKSGSDELFSLGDQNESQVAEIGVIWLHNRQIDCINIYRCFRKCSTTTDTTTTSSMETEWRYPSTKAIAEDVEACRSRHPSSPSARSMRRCITRSTTSLPKWDGYWRERRCSPLKREERPRSLFCKIRGTSSCWIVLQRANNNQILPLFIVMCAVINRSLSSPGRTDSYFVPAYLIEIMRSHRSSFYKKIYLSNSSRSQTS